MKTRYIVALSLLFHITNLIAGEFERTAERQPVDNQLLEEKDQQEELAKSRLEARNKIIEPHAEPTMEDRRQAIDNKAKNLYEGKGRSGLSSETDRIEKFKKKVKNLTTDAQNIMLELKKTESLDSAKIDSMLQEIDKTIAAEKQLSSWKGETSKEFMRELTETKTKLEQEKARQKTQTEKTKTITLQFEQKDPTAKPGKEDTKKQVPEKILIEREDLLKSYSFDPTTKKVSLQKDPKANLMITQLKSLVEDRSQATTDNRAADLDIQIEKIRDALTAHFKNLKDAAIDEYGKNGITETSLTLKRAKYDKTIQEPKDRAKLNEINTQLTELAQEQLKNISLSTFFDNQIKDILENPLYPNPKPDITAMKARKTELEKERKNLKLKIHNIEIAKIIEASPSELTKLKQQLKITQREITELDKILNPKAKPEVSKETKATISSQAQPEEEPQEKSPEQKAEDKIADLQKEKKPLITQETNLQNQRKELIKKRDTDKRATPSSTRAINQEIDAITKQLGEIGKQIGSLDEQVSTIKTSINQNLSLTQEEEEEDDDHSW